MDIVSRLVWNAKAVMAKVEAEVQQNMDRAAIFLQGKITESFQSPASYPEGGAYVGEGKGRHRQSKKLFRSGQHSGPGEIPFIQTGHLKRSITWAAPDKHTRLVGSSLKPQGGGKGSYALCLEYGTKWLAARPFLRPALIKWRSSIFGIIAGHGV